LEYFKIKSDIYSIDLNETLWNDKSKKTGYVTKKLNNSYDYVRHTFKIGGVIADFIEEIGNNIDFLIIDTAHTLPGEILDFVTCLPYMKENATVVLHDVGLNHMGVINPENAENAEYLATSFATKVLFDTVTADKYYMLDHNNPYDISNIAAFTLTDETEENILDVISALTLTWDYLPNKLQWESYLAIYKRKYTSEYVDRLERIYWLQARTESFRKICKHYKGEIRLLANKWRRTSKVYIYGCGRYGEIYYNYAKANALPVSGMIVSDSETIRENYTKQFETRIYHLSDVNLIGDDIGVVMAISGNLYNECLRNLIQIGDVNIL